MALFFSAWIPDESIYNFKENKEKFTPTNRIPRGFKEALEAVDDVMKAMPEEVSIKTNTAAYEGSRSFLRCFTGSTETQLINCRKLICYKSQICRH